MRIISQNGEYDLPYEMVVLRYTENAVYARVLTDMRDILIAVYDSAEQVGKHTQSIVNHYALKRPYFQFPENERTKPCDS